MICRDFPVLYSAQLDGHAAGHDQLALQRHLRECAMCRGSAAEMRSLRADLRALAAPLSDPELSGQIQKRLRQEAARMAEARAQVLQIPGAGINWVEFRKFWFNTFANWMDGWRAKIFSQSVGAIVSLLLFFVVVTEVFKQAYWQAYQALPSTIWETQVVSEDPNDKALIYQGLLRAALLPSPPPPALNPTYEFVDVATSLREQDVFFAAEVRKDGAATVMYLVPPNDPSVQAKLSTAMSQRGIFNKPNQHISTVAIVYLSSITTTARL